MNAERINPEVIAAAKAAMVIAQSGVGHLTPLDSEIEAAIHAADEKRRELAGAEGQEYAYRVCWEDAAGPARSAPMAIGSVDDFKEALLPVLRPTIWLERAPLGSWERVEQ